MDNIKEGNKIILHFMNGVILTTKSGREIYRFHDDKGAVCEAGGFADVKYHTSWDWLMPVVEKITPHIANDTLYVKSTDHFQTNLRNALYDVDITEAWKIIVEFINWYNQNK